MFNRSEIMKAAWAKWNAHFDARAHLARKLNRSDFGFYLAQAWREAKAAGMTDAATRAERIAIEIDRLKYQSSRINIEPRRRQLETELAALAG
ncbi:hypothetical protein [Mesorhizobium sp. NZP2077]|uniref:hypothetical protein n=1 Tax=Mesorhizobium sp. NZP2077 TaxID=2483404 RepID=UPI00155526DD|nr:hypothetical protein [Mesorhizobium sp. NZP2077]QKC81543.1 hypothetical protein EB232_07685 [Mesorhizobium sp. NZP2077]QKD14993.1 hypothetical protein HGP13_07575 [Mesorhizobium sp. NZP2077]